MWGVPTPRHAWRIPQGFTAVFFGEAEDVDAKTVCLDFQLAASEHTLNEFCRIRPHSGSFPNEIGTVPFRKVSVISWKMLLLYPAFVCDDRLLAVVADDNRRYAAESLQRVIVRLDPLYLFRGGHPFRINVLRIREDGNKDDNRRNLSCEPVNQRKGFAGKVHFHSLIAAFYLFSI